MVLLDWRKSFDKACYDILVDKMQTRAWRVLWENWLKACPVQEVIDQCDLKDGPKLCTTHHCHGLG